ncbi:protein kinase domain-containing protein [Acidiphilium sp.]|uniref:serine/threonine-protein kinase n=1 Tax=Acidiphilium sp. TaxID=527 RepID=UPI003D08F621
MAEPDVTALGKYNISRILGRGAMGVVYEGFDPIIARRVAIKTVRLDRVDDAEGAEDLLRFKREAQAAGRLTHPNIVAVYDYGETDTLAYIVMEFVEGETLKSLLDRGERFTPADAVTMMESLLSGIAYSHDNGVIHRDIKPANVMITRDGRVKLADFGVARIESSSLTQAGTMIGTPSYMSPEQFMGQTIDARTDIYSSGVLLYQLLTGEKPFEGSVTAIMHKVLNVEPPAPSLLSVSVAPALDDVVRRAMAKRPEDRFATARDFAAALRASETAVDADATMITPKEAPYRVHEPVRELVQDSVRGEGALPGSGVSGSSGSSRRFAVIGGMVGVLVVGAGIAFYAWHRGSVHQTQPEPVAAAPAPVVHPAPPSLPRPPAADVLRAKLAAAVAPISCALVEGSVSDNGASLSGIVAAADRMTLAQAVTQAVAPLPITSTLRIFTGPYCGLLEAARPYAPMFAPVADRLRLHLAGNATTLSAGQKIVIDLHLPIFARYVEVDYVTSRGATYRLYPNATSAGVHLVAGSRLVLGQPPGPLWAVGKPYGRDMILAIASSAPIDPSPGAASTTVGKFLPALRADLSRLRAQGDQTRTAAILLDTVP